jgi:ABC-type uncharacterized transport system substrate-binding protein
VPGDLPVEVFNEVNLEINMNTARELGITFSPYILVLADVVIE